MRTRRWLQFNLRSLLMLHLVAGFALWWWFRPYYVEEQSHYDMSIHYKLRRNWTGHKYYQGPMTMRYHSGSLAVRVDANGKELGSVDLWVESDFQCEYWHSDGRKLEWDEWFIFMSIDYVPRQMGVKTMDSEEKWRKAVEDFRSTGK